MRGKQSSFSPTVADLGFVRPDAVRYVKVKREKVGACTICKRFRELTYDHIPPSAAGNTDPVMLISAMSAISGRPQEDRPLISQNGYKIRSICRDCNSALGREYDPVIGQLCADIKRYLASPLTLPAEAAFDTKPARLIRGLLGHLLAAKLAPDENLVDQQIREFLADHTLALDPGLHLYYWLYLYPPVVLIQFLRADHLALDPQAREIALQSKAKTARFIDRVHFGAAFPLEPGRPMQKRFFCETLRRLGVAPAHLANHHVKILVHIDSQLDRASAAIKLAAGFLV
jgi:hypothetical protein